MMGVREEVRELLKQLLKEVKSLRQEFKKKS